MVVQTPLFLQKTGADADVTYSATNYRLSMIAAMCQITGVVDPLGSNGLQVTQRGAGANFSVDVASGWAYVPGGDVAQQGSYVVFNDATVNVATASAPGSGTRVHRVVLQIRDKLNNGTYSTYDGQLQVLADTGSGTPATPASAISLATVSISAGQANVSNANITDTRAWARWALSTTGALTPQTAGSWNATDSNRPPSWKRTADGFVHLYGWLQYTGSSTSVSGSFTIASGIPTHSLPNAFRDSVAACSVGGFIRIIISTGGIIQAFPPVTETFNNLDWISLDGISYKIGA